MAFSFSNIRVKTSWSFALTCTAIGVIALLTVIIGEFLIPRYVSPAPSQTVEKIENPRVLYEASVQGTEASHVYVMGLHDTQPTFLGTLASAQEYNVSPDGRFVIWSDHQEKLGESGAPLLVYASSHLQHPLFTLAHGEIKAWGQSGRYFIHLVSIPDDGFLARSNDFPHPVYREHQISLGDTRTGTLTLIATMRDVEGDFCTIGFDEVRGLLYFMKTCGGGGYADPQALRISDGSVSPLFSYGPDAGRFIFSEDYSTVYVSSTDGNIVAHYLENGTERLIYTARGNIEVMRRSPERHGLMVVERRADGPSDVFLVRFQDSETVKLSSKEAEFLLQPEEYWSPDRQYVWLGESNGAGAHIIDSSKNRVLHFQFQHKQEEEIRFIGWLVP